MNSLSTGPAARETPTLAQAKPANVVVTTVLLLTLPFFVYYLWFCLTFNHGDLVPPQIQMLQSFPLPNITAATIVIGWLAFQALLQIYAPGKQVDGPLLPDGSRLKYKLNGWFSWWSTWTVLAVGILLGVVSPASLVDQFGALLTTANIVCYLLCFLLYWNKKRFKDTQQRASNSVILDFWLGTALNPRIRDFDLKLFCEARPGLIAWVVFDFAFAAKQYQLHGFVSTPMILVCAFHFWYVADYFFHEEAILTTWDVKHEHFGWMLCWGSLVWVPFTYTIQAFYLVEHAHDLPWWGTAAIVLLNFLGYVIFRGANFQKHMFRSDSKRLVWGKPAQYIATSHGSLLLTSGWWGYARHMNYLGDLLMALAWCLPCLFGSPLPYLYLVYMTILLLHRERRDNARCAARYGKDWQTYCAKVRYRIIPGVY
jgi:protein-S-isoprenylcysteine O-methyltransferase Ste14